MTGSLSVSFFADPHESQATQHSFKAIYTTASYKRLKKIGNDFKKENHTERQEWVGTHSRSTLKCKKAHFNIILGANVFNVRWLNEKP